MFYFFVKFEFQSSVCKYELECLLANIFARFPGYGHSGGNHGHSGKKIAV
jgi:hypothetical protein